MKKMMNWVLAAILVCSTSVFTSCTNDDNPAVEPDLNVAEKIIGKWMVAERDGELHSPTRKLLSLFCLPLRDL